MTFDSTKVVEEKGLGEKYTLHGGDCLDVLKRLPENSVDAIVTDPPYGLSFMGKKWDYDVPSVAMWREALRVLKPGGHLLSFGGTRTYHRMAVNIEDAGFQIRDQMLWVYGSGFPKSHNISKAIDKAAGIKGEIVEQRKPGIVNGMSKSRVEQGARPTVTVSDGAIRAPGSDAAKQWDGWGTALKPAHEPICLAQKPISEKTIAANVLEWGTGAINIDATRIGMTANDREAFTEKRESFRGVSGSGWKNVSPRDVDAEIKSAASGRFPSNLLLGCAPNCTDIAHDMFECPIARLDEQSGMLKSGGYPAEGHQRKHNGIYGKPNVTGPAHIGQNAGGASRFFYCAKSSKRERNEGCEGLPEKAVGTSNQAIAEIKRGNTDFDGGHIGMQKVQSKTNHHPTVKPIALMRYLVRLVTPPGGTVLDPFTGSGSTGVAALKEGFKFVGVEREPEYQAIARARIEAT